MLFLKVFVIFSCFTASIYAKEKQKCGQTPIPPNIDNENIIGGNFAKKYSWPWQILFCHIFEGKKCYFVCGGTIINTQWIMTAGHCVGSYIDHAYHIRVISGVYDQRDRNETGEVINKVKAIYRHPKYNESKGPLNFDVALIELSDPIKYDNHTQPICLPTKDATAIVEPNTAWTTGWGMKNDKFKGRSSWKLRQVKVPFVNFKTCEKEYPNEINEKVMVCAGIVGKGVCYGDSGGPLVVKNKNGAWFQYGITSWGEGCALKDHPAVYSRVSAYCNFIESTTNGTVTCQNPVTYF